MKISNVLAGIVIIAIILIGIIYAQEKHIQADDVNLLILPENQTKFVDETAEYKVSIKIEPTGFVMECKYDNKIPFRTKRYEEYEKNFTYTITSKDTTTKKFSHNLYCFYTDSAGQRYVWNITKYGSVKFIGYPLNFSVEISNETHIDCENPYGTITGKLINKGREDIACYYTKIYANKGIIRKSKERFSIPSPIRSHESSEFYINVNLDDIPKKLNITCWNAHNEGKSILVPISLNADLKIHKKIKECESRIKILKAIADKEKIPYDFTDVETKLSYAKRYESNKGCIAAERYANECEIMLNDINETIGQKILEREKENAMIQNTKRLKSNASACINRLRYKILNLSSLSYGNKTAVFADSASDMLKTAEKNFVDKKYNESILSCRAGEKDVEMALKVYEEEIKEKENAIKENKTKTAENTENLTAKQKSEQNPEQQQSKQHQFDYTLIAIIVIIILIILIIVVLGLLYRQYKK